MNDPAAELVAAYPVLGGPDAAPHLRRVKRLAVPAGATLFRPGDAATGFVLVLAGRIGVHLTGAGGRELLLYSVGPGATCIQTTLGLMGGEAYSGEAVAETDVTLALLPAADFSALLDASKVFRAYVFQAFGARMADVTRTLERVAFVRVEARLAAHLLAVADEAGRVGATHAEIAVAIGSAREVVSRRLDALARLGLVSSARGAVRILDRPRLAALAGGD